MYKVELRIFHKTCWGSQISLKFPNTTFCSIDCHWIKNQVAHILLARADPLTFKKIITYLNNRKDVLTVEPLSADDQNLYLRILTKKDSHTSQFSDVFFENNCFTILPTRFEGKFEIWTLGTAIKKNFTTVYNKLAKEHELKLTYLKEEQIKDTLTKKQRDVLNYAKHFGYYEWPRKNTITQICKLLNMPKTVFLSHLRKAENKIISNFLSK